MKVLDLFQPVSAPLLEESPDDVGDLYLDIAEAYMESGIHSEARFLLATLVHSEKYNLVNIPFRISHVRAMLMFNFNDILVVHEYI